jgi:NADH-quinone oxidoreductase subunit M
MGGVDLAARGCAVTLAVLLIVLPALGSLVVALSPKQTAKWTGFAASLVVLAVACIFAWQFNHWTTGKFEPDAEGWELFKTLGVSFRLGADSISMLVVLLSALLIPCALLVSFKAITERQRAFYAQFLLLEAGVMLAVLSRDVILFYVGYEFTLVPLFFIVAIWGGSERKAAGIRLWVFSFLGSVISLVGFVYLGVARSMDTGQDITFGIAELTQYGQSLPAEAQWWVFLALMVGFAVKVPLLPAHAWLPLAHSEAPTAGSVLLAGVVIKLGQYGAIRFALPMAPEGGVALAQLFAILSVIAIITMSLICWVQNDVKRLVAYSSVAHMGLAMLALFAFNMVGMEGSLLYMVNHGLSTAGLFMCIGIMYERYHTKDMEVVGGLAKRMPIWACFMVFFAMASLALPGLNGFISEFLCLFGAFTSEHSVRTGFEGLLGPTYSFLAAISMVLAALYILRMLQKLVFGPLREPHGAGHAHDPHVKHDLSGREILAMAPIAVACLAIGLYPKPLLTAIEPAAQNVLRPYSAIIERHHREASRSTDNVVPVSTSHAAVN